MGVLGDDDIEKLNESFRKRKIPKLFHDPKKAYNFAWWSLYFCVLIIFVLSATVIMLWSSNYLSDNMITQLVKDKSNLIDRLEIQHDRFCQVSVGISPCQISSGGL